MMNFGLIQLVNNSDLLEFAPTNTYNPSLPIQHIEASPEQLEKPPKIEQPTCASYLLTEYSQIREKIIEKPILLQTGKGNKNKRKTTDQDYRPQKDYKNIKKTTPKQKQDRNLIPNMVHHLLAFVQNQFKSNHLTKRIFMKINKNQNYTVSRFYNFHKMLKFKINNYVNQRSMKIVMEEGVLDYSQYDQQQQIFYCRVSRILVRLFLKNDAIIMALLCKKIKKENILDHLNVQRYLYENMLAEQGHID